MQSTTLQFGQGFKVVLGNRRVQAAQTHMPVANYRPAGTLSRPPPRRPMISLSHSRENQAPHAAESLAALILGYVSVAALDSIAARCAEAPRYVAYFGPLQMVLPTLSIVVLLTRVGEHHPAAPPALQSDALGSEPIAQIETQFGDEAPSLRDLR